MSGIPPIGAEGELRKDKAMTCSSSLYRVYLDNFDALEKTEANLAGQIKGSVKPQVETLRAWYAAHGLSMPPKESRREGHSGRATRGPPGW